MAERLIPSFGKLDKSSMTDRLTLIAREIEDSLVQCGATPGEDYTYKDVFNWSVSVLVAEQKIFNK